MVKFLERFVNSTAQQEMARLAEQEAARREIAAIILGDNPPVPLLFSFIGESAERQDYHSNPVIKDAYCRALTLIERDGLMSEDALYAFRLMHEERGERIRQINELRAGKR